jgi:hypothetical protein
MVGVRQKVCQPGQQNQRPSCYNTDSAVCGRPNAATSLDLGTDWDLCTAERPVPKRRYDGNSIPRLVVDIEGCTGRRATTKWEGW